MAPRSIAVGGNNPWHHPATRVNNRQIRGATPLHDGDRICLGEVNAVFESGAIESSGIEASAWVDIHEQRGQAGPCGVVDLHLRRWLVSFASGQEWYSVGELLALNGPAAIDGAVEVFGAASDYRAEEISWDAAPLPRPKPRN